MSTEAKTVHPMARAIFGIAALIIIVVAANILVNSLGIGHKNADFTKDKVHSLSDGTKAILKELGAPVTIRYYATESSDYLPEQIKLHMRRVSDLLAEYQNLSGGKLRIEKLDPTPDSDAEDSANLDGISGQQINDQNLYFGLAISCLDKTSAIPFLNPQQETMLEYDLSRAISEVSRPKKPVIGLMSALPVTGGAGNPMMGQRGTPPWVIVQQLKQSYEVKDLTMTPEKIDSDVDLVLVIHPAGITPEAEFALDQYVLQGGTVVACLDPYSVVAESQGGGNPMMGGGGVPNSSTLPTLLPAWGISLNTQVMGDGVYGLPNYGPLLPQFPADAMPQKDDIITKNLKEVVFYLPGGFTKTGSAGVAVTTLIKSSNKAAFITPTPAEAQRPSKAVASKLKPTGQTYDAVLHLAGNFKSAFPKGKPGTEEAKDEDKKDGEAKKDEKKPEEPHLVEATKAGNVFLISDVDAFFDAIAFQVQRLGNMQIAQPQNGNSVLLFNIVDQAASSPHLIGSRSRAAVARPFVKFDEMEQAAEEKSGIEEKKLDEEASEAEKKIMEIQSQRTSNDGRYTPEQKSAIAEFTKKKVESERKKRDLQKDLRRAKDRVAGNVTLLNVAAMPLLVILAGIGMLVKRRSSTRAR
ncbi:Gldg family protein [Haloferula sp. BvORR071]|uniref:GldG family protein n=1 Tax=Haloferula sp. BvORR071 TaxID=1396141 RepID=UPI000558FDF1|nr:Gldg family protein [Haloferula sp. BvORR071]